MLKVFYSKGLLIFVGFQENLVKCSVLHPWFPLISLIDAIKYSSAALIMESFPIEYQVSSLNVSHYKIGSLIGILRNVYCQEYIQL